MNYFNYSAEQIKEIREIQALRQLSNNSHILQLHEVILYVLGLLKAFANILENVFNFYYFSEKRSGTLCLIFELMDMNIYEMIRSIIF